MIEKFRNEKCLLIRHEANPIITKDNFPIPVQMVFNCGQTMYNGKTVLLVAAVYMTRINGNITGIHVAMSEDGVNFDINPEPLCKSVDWAGECPGVFDGWVIDPRVTEIDDTYYIVRPAQVKGAGPGALLEKTKDFKTCEFVDCIALPSNRVPCLFPEKIGDYYIRLDRPYNLHEQEDPKYISDDSRLEASIWISYSPDLKFWGKYKPIIFPNSVRFANWKIGPTPPIRTEKGWLEIIHGVYKEKGEFCYSIGAMLLDLENPEKIIGISDDILLTPQEPYEIYGRTENVVFPCGAIADVEKDILRIYYGCADERIGLATGKLSEIIDSCLK